ncbi:hypothetical protein BRE01_07080 [Brevibacillus reuszeri]|uniref:Hydantoinase n=1 Tax=Brevibacillus reuszeri TaxID=54915 RepID=A0A0K9YPZ7_9BACL|nr:DUF917 domain-containing protein [Brevibacillus reuszeri]KNB70793.1 hypothetical protein ADS79_18205 [Brevibacillus reuszeri]MED1857172.1 DUF917 domain-containing protein [Brevibacillus reuszeri]GED67006.1 hypothetical protein BRE01_07080 [Brevibacillus reuszeri]
MPKSIDERFVDSLACGAMFLGSGGAGDSALLQIMAKQAIKEFGPVQLVSPFELRDEDWVVTIALMGSPAIHYEKMMSGQEMITALREMEKEERCVAQAITALEIGGINALPPVLTAALTKLPLVDCDGMGRAFPELQMTTYHAFGAQASPLVLCANNGESEKMISPSNFEIEKVGRVAMTKMGGSVATASFPMKAKRLQEVGIPHTFLLSHRIGEAVLRAGADVHRVFTNLHRELQNSIYGQPFKLIEGKVVELERYLQNGLLRGELLVEGTGFYHSEQIEVQFQSEYLLAKKGERILGMVPDLICVLDADNGLPILIEELETHMNVWVIAIPCPIILRHAKMMDVIGPWNFGISNTYTPVEHLCAEEGNGDSHVPFRY